MSARPSTLSLLLLALCLLHTGLTQDSPDDDYEEFPWLPGSRYRIDAFPLSWADALVKCQSDGGGSHLLVINSEEEAALVKKLVFRIFSVTRFRYAWVGISDVSSEGDWRTVQGGLVSESGYNKWQVGEPKEGTAQNCGLVWTDALYYGYTCSEEIPFICEKPNV